MAFEKLTEREQKVVLQAMNLILTEDTYIPDWECRVRTGISRDELRQVISEWPNISDECDENSEDNPDLVRILAINNSLNEVLNGVDVSETDWAKWIGEPRDEVKRIYRAWAMHKGKKSTGLM